MRGLFWLLFLFALAVAVTLAARFDEGYVLVVLPPWRLEMSFALAALSLLGLYAAIHVAVRVVTLALRLPADVRAWRERKRGSQAEDDLTRAVAAYLAGQGARAHSLAAGAFRHDQRPLAALLAAHAALAEGDAAAARAYLENVPTDAAELDAARQAAEAKLAEAESVDQAMLRG